MKTKSLIYVLGVLALGCGGSGAGTPTASPFEGTYVGTWDTQGTSGPETMNIDQAGNITGTLTKGSSQGTTTGKIQNNGNFTFTLTGVGGTFYLTGTATLDSQGDLNGQYTYTGTFSGSGTFDLAKQ